MGTSSKLQILVSAGRSSISWWGIWNRSFLVNLVPFVFTDIELMFIQFIEGYLFFFHKHLLAFHQVVEVHQVPVKIRTMETGKFCFIANRHTARTTHTRAINHDGV